MAERGIALASGRAGNVIGGGDWATDRLIPDILRAVEKDAPALVRNPLAIRPWQHVLEPLSGYLILAEALCRDPEAAAEAWNFGPRDEDARPVQWIVERMCAAWGQGAEWIRDESVQPHEAHYLKLDISKARARLTGSPAGPSPKRSTASLPGIAPGWRGPTCTTIAKVNWRASSAPTPPLSHKTHFPLGTPQ